MDIIKSLIITICAGLEYLFIHRLLGLEVGLSVVLVLSPAPGLLLFKN